MSLQQKIDRITDILRRDDGISGAMHYTEQTSWVLFLKFLDDYDLKKEDEAILSGKVINQYLMMSIAGQVGRALKAKTASWTSIKYVLVMI